MSGYQPDGGWSGRIVADAPPPAPVVVERVVPTPATNEVGAPGFMALCGALLVSALFIEVLGVVLFLYVLALIMASAATFDGGGAAIFVNVVWTLVSIPVVRAVVQMICGWSPKLYPLGLALFLGLAARYTLELVGAPKLVAVLAAIPLEAVVLFSGKDSFTRATPTPR